jgi:alkyl sulfatase BDS1-like metallo-beta-lactamase superfamily hydrolase
MGGSEAVLAAGKRALSAGDYRWGAELMNHLVFAEPDNQEAKNVEADILEQLGYQAESAPWRNFYLSGAQELRNGVTKLAAPMTAASKDLVSGMSLDLIFGYMGIELNAQRASGKKITINWQLPDTKQKYALYLEHSVLNAWPDSQDDAADATVTLDRATLDDVLTKQVTLEDAMRNGKITVAGDGTKLRELLACLDDLQDSFWFDIVTP